MLIKIRGWLRNENFKRILTNILSLSSLQYTSYLLPVIYLPYLIKTLGPELFGLIILAETLVQYFILFTDYGFGLTATKEIAENKDNRKKVDEIFSSVLFLKVILLIIVFLVLILLLIFIPQFNADWEIFIIYFGMVIGQVIFPVWFFQGIEKMKFTAIFNIIPKIIFTLLVFFFVKSKADYLYVPILNGFGYLFSGFLSLSIAIFYFKLKFYKPKIQILRKYLIDGWYIFIGVLSSNLANLNVTFLLGIFTSNLIVGYYSAINKIILPLSQLIRPISSALFPYLANLKTKSNKAFENLVNKTTLVIVLCYGILGIIIFSFAKDLILQFFGQNYLNSVLVLKIMAFYPMVNSVYYMYCIPNLILYNHKRIYSRILFISLIISVIMSLILIKNYQHIGASITVIFTSAFTMVYMTYYIRKLNRF